ncbi:phage antirepressor KilAC domain-containing protein [Paenibacillus ehimensis]|uniref:Phage antirepressor KilAC domain-containing protein n=1 Tax=Paenibacillus ehimensis TaxID=79264 RepID=A0ABT8VLW6_9BACL|nr:phage antirepressor KilAC domain-containing protein [Paenibacillus ehimensis]MDO3681969.1 phage antirepressor KilAC domain-containing protein [Paenibacillus ehimensis]
MNKLVFIENNCPVTDSLTVAEVFGKQHDDVLRDVRKQIEKLHAAGEMEFSLRNFAESTYTNDRGRAYPKINLTEDAFAIVAMSYVTPEAMKMKVRFLEEFKRMREALQAPTVPQTLPEALRMAADLAEKNESLRLQSAQKDQIISELQPKATYYDLILQNKSVLAISKIAKDYGMSAKSMNALLHDLGVQFKQGDCWLLYQRFADKGYTQSRTQVIDDERSRMHTYWTQKGRLFIYELLKSRRGILPVIERINTHSKEG